MSGYRRFVAYVYEYLKGKKKTTGILSKSKSGNSNVE